MSNLALVQSDHLKRRAVVYIRQSTEQQVCHNVESRRLQHAMREKARSLGWDDDRIDVVESDTGRTGRTIAGRTAYKQLLSDIAVGDVGVVVSYESARLSRNCSDWYPLLDVCAASGCLIADRDGVYDPSTANGRLLLGMKGILSEVELHTLSGRLRAGIESKARRGDLKMLVPTGFVHLENGRVVKDPDLGVQKAIEWVFAHFMQLKSANRVTCLLNEEGLSLPRRQNTGELLWKKADRNMVVTILKNPAYAGAFVYGRRKEVHEADGTKHLLLRRDIDQWRVMVKDRYPAYVSWETFERIQEILKDNHAEYRIKKTRGVTRDGAALLQGIVYCGACGHKMFVQYKRETRYICNYRNRRRPSEAVCQNIDADAVDQGVVKEFFAALAPAELDVYEMAMQDHQRRTAEIDAAKQRELERLRYEVNLARRQYDRVDPDNRLVASELERRWEVALRALRETEEEIRRGQASREKVIVLHVPQKLREAFEALGEKLPGLWRTPLLKEKQRKALLRCLIDKIVLHRSQEKRERVAARIVWRGGAVTELDIRVPVNSFQELSYLQDMETRIRALCADGISDGQIATILTQEGYHSTAGKGVTRGAVKRIRLACKCFRGTCSLPLRHLAGSLTIPQVATLLGVKPYWLHNRIRRRIIEIKRDPLTRTYPFPNNPETIANLRHLRDGLISKLWIQGGHQDE